MGWADHAHIHRKLRRGSEGYHLAGLYKNFNHPFYKYFHGTSFVLGLMYAPGIGGWKDNMSAAS